MKAVAVLLAAAAAGVSGVGAQNYPPNIPQCGTVCGDNLLAMYRDFGCSSRNDYACLCRNVNFGYGIHDCAVEACQNNDAANVVIDWGNQLCNSVGVAINIPPASVAATGTGLTTSTFTSTFTSGGNTITTTGATTIFTGTRTGISTGTSTTTFTSNGATFTSTSTSTIFSSTRTGTSSTSSRTSTSSNGGAVQTAAPIAGLLAAAGFAAVLL